MNFKKELSKSLLKIKKEVVNKVLSLPKPARVILGSTSALVLMFGVTSANFSGDIEEATEHFSKLSVITEINGSSIEIETLNESPVEELKINTNYLEVIQTEEYDELEINDLSLGDQIIVQGLTDGEFYFAKRIISFTTEIEIVLDETATSTLDILNASSTATTTIDFENASSTNSENASSTSTSTNATSTDEQSDESEGGSGGASSESSEETASTTSATSTDDITNASSTATTTPENTTAETASSTEEIIIEETATSTATSTDGTSETSETTTATTTPENTTTETASSTEETSPEPDTEIPSEEVSAPPEDPTVSESTESATEPESLPAEEPTA